LYGWYADELNIYIAMEYAPYQDLQYCVQQALPEEEVKTITIQVLEALEALHARDWAHRDLKPSVSMMSKQVFSYSFGLERICH
jgi:serine/threonine protein kinase